MSNIKERVDFVLRGGCVERFHTRPLIHKQNNAEHQYGVASIAALLDPEISKESLLHILWHDIAEGQTGDIPYYSKLRWPGLKQTLNQAEAELAAEFPIVPDYESPLDKITLKIAEYLDVLIFTVKETYLGNKEFKVTIQECVQLVIDLAKSYPRNSWGNKIRNKTLELLDLLMREYEEKTGEKWYSESFAAQGLQATGYTEQEIDWGEDAVQDEIIQ